MDAGCVPWETAAARMPSLRMADASARIVADSALAALAECHRLGRPVDVFDLWRRHAPDGDLYALSDLIKADIRRRFANGETPAAADYLAACEALRADKDRVVSLAYEEYCLLDERSRGGRHAAPTPDSFCDRYPTWRDSLRSQLDYHRVISQMIGPTSSPARWPSIGEVVEGCRLDESLGKGGAASVFRAFEQPLGDRLVVLKLTTDQGEEEDVLGKLSHRHIVGIHWARPRNPQTGLRSICMPYKRGATLEQVLAHLPRPGKRRAAIDLWKALQAAMPGGASPTRKPTWPDFPAKGTYADAIAWLAWKLADALAHAHNRKVIHRDLKPANILLTVEDGPQLLDFNLAHNPNSPERAESAMRGGTLPYMAPEQLEAFLDERFWDFVGPRSDLYALALVARELLTGLPQENPGADLPRARAVAEMLDRRKRPQAPIQAEAGDVPNALAAILARCTRPRPIDRYPDAASLADDLRRCLQRRPLLVARNPSFRERMANRVYRARYALAASGIALCLGGLAWLGAWTRSALNPPPSFALLGQTLGPYAAAIHTAPADPAVIRRAILALDTAGRQGNPPASWINARSILECLVGDTGPIHPDGGPGFDDSSVPTDTELAAFFHDHGKDHLSKPMPSQAEANEAMAAFRLSLAFEPRNPGHWMGLASACYSAGRLEEGAEHASRAIDLADCCDEATDRTHVLAKALKLRGVINAQRAASPSGTPPSGRKAREDLFARALQDIDRAEGLAAPSKDSPPESSRVLRRELAFLRGQIQSELADHAEAQGEDTDGFLRALDSALAFERAEQLRREELGLPPTGVEPDQVLTVLYPWRRQSRTKLAEFLDRCRGGVAETTLANGTPALEAARRFLDKPRP